MAELTVDDLVERMMVRLRESASPILDGKVELRQRMVDSGWILPPPAVGSVPPPVSMCAVDGGRATEKLYSGDLLTAYAVSAEAESSQRVGESVDALWADVLPHSGDADKVAGLAMLSLEYRVLSRVQHEVRLLDGSFASLFLELGRALSIASPGARLAAEEILASYSLFDDAVSLLSPDAASRVVALGKSDSGRVFSELLRREFGIDVSLTDKVLAAYLLEPGERFRPLPFASRAPLEFKQDWSLGRAMARDVNALGRQLNDASRDGSLVVSFIRPMHSLGILRAEYFRAGAGDEGTDAWVAATLLRECNCTHAMEPAAQFKADVLAKRVSQYSTQLRELLVNGLIAAGDVDIASLVRANYRSN